MSFEYDTKIILIWILWWFRYLCSSKLDMLYSVNESLFIFCLWWLDFPELEVTLKKKKKTHWKLKTCISLFLKMKVIRKINKDFFFFFRGWVELNQKWRVWGKKNHQIKSDISVNELIFIFNALYIDNSGFLDILIAIIFYCSCDLNFIIDNIIYDDNENNNELEILTESAENNFSYSVGNILNNAVDHVNNKMFKVFLVIIQRMILIVKEIKRCNL